MPIFSANDSSIIGLAVEGEVDRPTGRFHVGRAEVHKDGQHAREASRGPKQSAYSKHEVSRGIKDCEDSHFSKLTSRIHTGISNMPLVAMPLAGWLVG